MLKKVTENVQAILQSHTANQHMASRGIIASEHYQSYVTSRKTIKAMQSNWLSVFGHTIYIAIHGTTLCS